jgi:hypothetical protein
MSRGNARIVATTLALTFTLAACAGQRGEDGDGSASASASTTPSRPLPATITPSPSTDPVEGGVPEALLGEIVADAADRAGVAADELEVITAEAVTFNDGSLGCPEPGMAYTQALVDGYHVVVRGPFGDLDYRASRLGGFRFCANPGDPGSTGTE